MEQSRKIKAKALSSFARGILLGACYIKQWEERIEAPSHVFSVFWAGCPKERLESCVGEDRHSYLNTGSDTSRIIPVEA